MSPCLGGAGYSDVHVPGALKILPEGVEFLARLCAARDFGL